MDDSKLESKNVLPKDTVDLYRRMAAVIDELTVFARDSLHISVMGKSPEATEENEYREEAEPYLCPQCGFTAMELRISYYADSQADDFHGEVRGTCEICKNETLLFCIVGQRQEGGTWHEINDVQKEEHPVCTCGSSQFYPVSYSLFEADFFDEGALVAQCAHCAGNLVMACFD